MSNEKNQIALFEKQNLEVFQKLSEITRTRKHLEDQEKQVKEQLERAMDEHDIKSIDNNYLKITRVNSSTSTSIDIKELQKQEPKLHAELITDYPKVSNRKAYVTFKVK